jgi:hypothetical protein
LGGGKNAAIRHLQLFWSGQEQTNFARRVACSRRLNRALAGAWCSAPCIFANHASPAALRLHLHALDSGLEVSILKARGEEVIQCVSEETPAAYFKGMLSLVQKDVSLEGHFSQVPLKTEPMSATIAFLEQFSSKNDDSPGANETARYKSGTAA